MPLLLDFLTVFFLVAGGALLWLNLRPQRPRVVITKTDYQALTGSALENALLDVLQRHLSEAEANPGATEENPLRTKKPGKTAGPFSK